MIPLPGAFRVNPMMGMNQQQSNPMMDKLAGLPMNPLFMMGMGMMQGNQKSLSPTNPLGGGMQGLLQAAQMRQQDEQTKLRKKLIDAQLEETKSKPVVVGGVLVDPETGKEIYRSPNADTMEDPANVKEWKFYNELPEDQKQEYLRVKRAQTFLDVGSGFVAPNMVDPSLTPTPVATKGLAPADQPVNAYNKAAAGAEGGVAGQAMGERTTELQERVADFPRLEKVVTELNDLGQKATYTKAGQARDAVMRQLGMDMPDAAVARKEYISKVDNEILPLLRQTFGAQFTEREGESLKKTLGDVDGSPEEKDAVLRSFIATKKAQIEALQRQTGADPAPAGIDAATWGAMTPEEKALFK